MAYSHSWACRVRRWLWCAAAFGFVLPASGQSVDWNEADAQTLIEIIEAHDPDVSYTYVLQPTWYFASRFPEEALAYLQTEAHPGRYVEILGSVVYSSEITQAQREHWMRQGFGDLLDSPGAAGAAFETVRDRLANAFIRDLTEAQAEAWLTQAWADWEAQAEDAVPIDQLIDVQRHHLLRQRDPQAYQTAVQAAVQRGLETEHLASLMHTCLSQVPGERFDNRGLLLEMFGADANEVVRRIELRRVNHVLGCAHPDAVAILSGEYPWLVLTPEQGQAQAWARLDEGLWYWAQQESAAFEALARALAGRENPAAQAAADRLSRMLTEVSPESR